MSDPSHDETIQLIVATIRSAGHLATLLPEERDTHVGWGGKHIDDGPIIGVQRLLIQDGKTFEVITEVTFDSEARIARGDHFNMGYALNRPGRTLSTRWRIAEGYVNGFLIRDIIWYAITRHRTNHRFYKREQASRAAAH